MRFLQGFFIVTLAVFLNACGGRDNLAPVKELKFKPWSTHDKSTIVRSGDTLFAIAFKYDKDYHDLMRINHLPAHKPLIEGQKIILVEPHYAKYQPVATVNVPPRPYIAHNRVKNVKKNERLIIKPKKNELLLNRNNKKNQWIWPLKGSVTERFYPSAGKKGINIAGKKGESIKAASDGIVAYAGNGLTGYGNLIIIKHESNFLTAYGNNQSLLVREGQKVVAGQTIAKAGMIDKRYFGVHFEVRKSGVPVNPMIYLNKG